jgi:putative transposase
VSGEQRRYHRGKKVRGRKHHLLVDTEGLVVKAKVPSAKVPDQHGLRLLVESARSGLSRLRHLFGWKPPRMEGERDGLRRLWA